MKCWHPGNICKRFLRCARCACPQPQPQPRARPFPRRAGEGHFGCAGASHGAWPRAARPRGAAVDARQRQLGLRLMEALSRPAAACHAARGARGARRAGASAVRARRAAPRAAVAPDSAQEVAAAAAAGEVGAEEESEAEKLTKLLAKVRVCTPWSYESCACRGGRGGHGRRLQRTRAATLFCALRAAVRVFFCPPGRPEGATLGSTAARAA